MSRLRSCRRRESRNGMMLRRPLVAALSSTIFSAQIAMHAARRTQIEPLLEQFGIDLKRWLVAEFLAVREIQRLLTLGWRQGPGLNTLTPRCPGRLTVALALPVSMHRAPVQAQRPASHCERKSLRTLFQHRLHPAIPLRARSSIDKAFFWRSTQSWVISSLRCN